MPHDQSINLIVLTVFIPRRLAEAIWNLTYYGGIQFESLLRCKLS
jgi:hypothetical protein